MFNCSTRPLGLSMSCFATLCCIGRICSCSSASNTSHCHKDWVTAKTWWMQNLLTHVDIQGCLCNNRSDWFETVQYLRICSNVPGASALHLLQKRSVDTLLKAEHKLIKSFPDHKRESPGPTWMSLGTSSCLPSPTSLWIRCSRSSKTHSCSQSNTPKDSILASTSCNKLHKIE